uniref:CSON015488 protein n=1 Tax=Culicoides sonorensis TaxID=179676 RepID=A0A336LP77_CULSO
MTDIDIDLYDDLEVIPNKFEQEKEELVQKYETLKKDYDTVKVELDELRETLKNVKSSESALKILKTNYDSLQLTAQNEIERLKRQNTAMRKELDDVLFRRARPKYDSSVEKNHFGTQTDQVKKYNFGVQTDQVQIAKKNESKEAKTYVKDEKQSESRRTKRLRSKSLEIEEKSKKKPTTRENDRKRSKCDKDDDRNSKPIKNETSRDRKEKDKAREKTDGKTDTRKSSRKPSELKESRHQEKSTLNEKAKISKELDDNKHISKSNKISSRTLTNKTDTNEEKIKHENQVKSNEVQKSESKQKPVNENKQDSKEKSIFNEKEKHRLRKSSERTKKFEPQSENENVKIENQKITSKESVKSEKTEQNNFIDIIRESKNSPIEKNVTKTPKNDKDNEKNHELDHSKKTPLQLLWNERQIETTQDESQNTLDIFGSISDLSLSHKFDESQKSKSEKIINNLFSDSESTQKVCQEDLEDGELVEDPPTLGTKINDEIRQNSNQKNVLEEKMNNFGNNIEKSVKTQTSKNSISKIVPGTVDDSACDMGEIIQKQSSMAQNDDQISIETKISNECKNDIETVKSDQNQTSIESNPENKEKGTETKVSRLLEISDVQISDEESTPKAQVIRTGLKLNSLETIYMQNQDLIGDQSNISLLIAADIFLQNENTVKKSAEKNCEGTSLANETPKIAENKDKVKPFLGFDAKDQESSPNKISPETTNSNDSQKENICTPVVNQSSDKVYHHHGSTPKTMNKSEPKQLIAQLNSGPTDPTPDSSKEVMEESHGDNSTANDDSLNSSAKRKIIETKGTQYIVEERDDMVVFIVNRKKVKKEKKEKKSKKHKNKDKKRRSSATENLS